MELRELAEGMESTARKIIADGEELVAAWTAEKADGTTMVLVTPWRNDEEKRGLQLHIKLMFLVEGVVRFAFASEAWVSHYDKKEDRPDGLMPIDDPNRTEALIVSAASRFEGEEPLLGTARILPGTPRVVDDMRWTSKGIEGNLSEMLPPPGVEISPERIALMRTMLEISPYAAMIPSWGQGTVH